MFVKTFPVGSFQCNCTILADAETGEAIVIDPGDEALRILKILEANQFTLKYLLHTHAHIDHIGATCVVKEKTGGQIALHREDLFLYENIGMQAQFLGLPPNNRVLPVDWYFNHGDGVEWGKENKMSVLHTPGHTPGSVSFVVKNLMQNRDGLFTGDTLFLGSIGRTDLWGGDYDQIISSIKEKLLKLDDNVLVLPGHGPNTTIGQEKKLNPFLS